MKSKGIIYYLATLIFLGWCLVMFRADIAQIKFTPILVAWDWVLLAGALSLFNYLLRVVRWSFYLSRLGHAIPFRFSALTYIAGFAFTLSPGKVGEMIRGRYLQKEGIPLSKTAAAFFIERLMDLLAILVLACFAITETSYHGLIWGTVIVIALIITSLVLAPLTRLSAWMQDAIWLPKFLHTLAQTIIRALLSAKVLLSPSVLISGFLLGFVAWGSKGVGLLVISHMVAGVSMDAATAISIYSVAVIVGALSFLPGGLGSTEAVMVALLTTHGYRITNAVILSPLKKR